MLDCDCELLPNIFEDQVVCVGKKFKLCLPNEYKCGYLIQWQVSKNGKYWKDIAVCEKNRLCLKFQADPDLDGYFYRVILRSKCKCYVTNAAKLTVVCPPKVIKQPCDQNFGIGQPVSFISFACGYDVQIQWQISRNRGKTWDDIDGATSHELVITPVEGDESNLYRACFTSVDCCPVYSDPAGFCILLSLDLCTIGQITSNFSGLNLSLIPASSSECVGIGAFLPYNAYVELTASPNNVVWNADGSAAKFDGTSTNPIQFNLAVPTNVKANFPPL